MSSNNFSVGVVGSGVIGLSSALYLKTQHRNLDVTVISDKELAQTTSYGPPGLFRPTLNPSNDVIKQWSRDSYNHYIDLAKSADGPMAGVQLVSGYCLSDNKSWLQWQENDYGDIVTNFRWMEESDMEIFTIPYKYGYFYTATTAQTHFYLPWLAQTARLAGCKFVKRSINAFDELSDRFDLLVNCTGLAARRLVPDETVVPVRGITVQVSAPWIKHFLLFDDGHSFFIPGIDSTFLGTVREENSWKMEVDVSERRKIINRCSEMMSSLKRARFLDEWVGLRPHRPVPRLETEIIETKSGRLPIIHNYGHGGHGITMSWGTAVHVDRLVKEQLRMKAKL